LDILTKAQNVAALAKIPEDFLKLVDEARKQITSSEALLKALVDYANNPAGGGVIAQAVATLNLNGPAIQQFVTANQSRLTLLLGTVGDFGGKDFEWPVEASGAANAGVVAINVGATASASIRCDVDGDLFDDQTVTYDKNTEAYVSYQVEGTLTAGANVPKLPLGSVSAGAAFGASASLTVSNHFKHQQSDRALSAVAGDLRNFKLPYDAQNLQDGQIVRVHGTGTVAVSGQVSWGKTIVSTGDISDKAIGLTAAPVTASVELGASASFNAEMQGDFNLLVSRESQNKVRLQLVKATSRGSGFALSAGVGIDIKGLDAVANAVVQQIATPLNALVKILQEEHDKFSDLNDLFSKEVDNLATTVADQKIVGQIQAWLTKIGSSVDLKKKLQDVLKNAVDDQAGQLVDNLSANIAPLTAKVQQLITAYQKALKKANDAVKAAAEVKIGIELSRKQTSTESGKTTLDVILDMSVPAAAALLKPLIHGDFTEAIELGRRGGSGVELKDATVSGSGGLTIESSLNVSAFDNSIGAGSLLKQDWNFEISATGDLTIGVQESITAWSKSWRMLRSVTVLADTRLLAVLSSADKLLDPNITDSVTVSTSQKGSITKSQLSDFENKMKDIQVLAGATSMLQDLAVSSAASNLGELELSAFLKLTEHDLRVIAAVNTTVAATMFAKRLTQFYVPMEPFTETENGLPFLRWPDVIQFIAKAGGGQPTFPNDLVFGEKKVFVSKAKLQDVALAGRIVAAFEQMYTQLAKLHSKSLAGVEVMDAIASLRNEQRALMAPVKTIITATMMSRENLGFALFTTLWDLAGGQAASDPFVVIERISDNKRFVYF